jgi:hypothetical protein
MKTISAVVVLLSAGLAFAEQVDATVKATISPHVSVGQPAKIDIRFNVPAGSHISPDAPLTIKLKGPDGLKFDKPVLHYADAMAPAGDAPRFTDQATPSAAGDADIEAAMTYYVCTADLCNRQSKTEHLHLSVK